MPALIRFDQVTVTAQEKCLLKHISFSLNAGEKAVLCGQSGAGKSSVLKTLLGQLTVASGTVYFQDAPLSPQVVQQIRCCTAYISQEPLLGAATVREALLLPFQFKAHRADPPTEAQLLAVLQKLRLPDALLAQDCNRISGGEKQRLALARGLLLGKQVYLLDEVTSALDADSKQAVFEVFDDPALTVLSVAHDDDWLERCTIRIELAHGQLMGVTRHEHA